MFAALTRIARPTAGRLALVIALAGVFTGTSYAAFSVGTAQLRTGAVTSGKIHAHAVTAAKLATGAVTSRTIHRAAVTRRALARGSVHAASVAAGAITRAKLAHGAVPTVAYADVTPGATPSMVSAQSRGFGSVSSPSTGVYCLTPSDGLAPSTSTIVASVDETQSSLPGSAIGATAQVASGAGGCAAGQFEVDTAVLVNIAGVATLTNSNTVGFTVIAS